MVKRLWDWLVNGHDTFKTDKLVRVGQPVKISCDGTLAHVWVDGVEQDKLTKVVLTLQVGEPAKLEMECLAIN